MLNITGYNLFSRRHDNGVNKGGGVVAIYVRNELTASIIDVDVPNELECIWVNVRPRRLPREISLLQFVQFTL